MKHFSVYLAFLLASLLLLLAFQSDSSIHPMDMMSEELSAENAERLDALLAKLEPVGEDAADTLLLQLRHIELTVTF